MKNNSLLQTNPNLAKEWNYERNGKLIPEMFAANSNVKVWWRCSEGHEWQAVIYMRNGRGTGCPYCSNNKILPGYNDLNSRCPELMKEWDWNKNKELDPTLIAPGSGKKAWWVCSKCGYEWLAEISSRNKGSGCPNCNKHKRVSETLK